jgi:hypothetical protein
VPYVRAWRGFESGRKLCSFTLETLCYLPIRTSHSIHNSAIHCLNRKNGKDRTNRLKNWKISSAFRLRSSMRSPTSHSLPMRARGASVASVTPRQLRRDDVVMRGAWFADAWSVIWTWQGSVQNLDYGLLHSVANWIIAWWFIVVFYEGWFERRMQNDTIWNKNEYQFS